MSLRIRHRISLLPRLNLTRGSFLLLGILPLILVYLIWPVPSAHKAETLAPVTGAPTPVQQYKPQPNSARGICSDQLFQRCISALPMEYQL